MCIMLYQVLYILGFQKKNGVPLGFPILAASVTVLLLLLFLAFGFAQTKRFTPSLPCPRGLLRFLLRLPGSGPVY